MLSWVFISISANSLTNHLRLQLNVVNVVSCSQFLVVMFHTFNETACRFLDLQGVWLVKNRKDTLGWSFHLPRSSAGQNTVLLPPVTAWCSSWIRYLRVNTPPVTSPLLAWTSRFKLVTWGKTLDTVTDLTQPLLAMTSAWLSLRTSPKSINQT